MEGSSGGCVEPPPASSIGNGRRSAKSYMVGATPEVVLSIGLLIAWYVRWQTYHTTSVTFFGLAGLALVGTNLLLKYYFASVRFAHGAYYFWAGGLLVVTSLFDVGSSLDHAVSDLEDAANYILMASVAVKFVVEAACRLCSHNADARFGLWPFSNAMEFLGAYIACLLYGRYVNVLFTLLTALIMLISAVRLGSYWSLLILAFLVFATERYTFVNLGISTNPYAIICFMARQLIGPILDLAFCPNSRLQAWGEVLICTRKCTQKVLMFMAFMVQGAMFVMLASTVGNHKEWYIVVPMFSCLGAVWVGSQLALVCGVHALFARFSMAARDAQCADVGHMMVVVDSDTDHGEKLKMSDDGSLMREAKEKSHIIKLRQSLSAHGVRYLSLAITRLAHVQFAAGVLLMVLCWTTAISARYSCLYFYSSTVDAQATVSLASRESADTSTGDVSEPAAVDQHCEGYPCAPALFALATAITAALIELLSELSNNLGGTCVAYALIAPPVQCRSDGLVTVLPPNYVHEAGGQSTKLLQTLLAFMSRHMITNYGADWSMAASNLDALQKKVSDFFRQTTSEGPRFDTYLMYYSGPTNTNGDWALSGGQLMGLGKLLSLWKDANVSGSSRLVIVCDCQNSHQWLRPVWRISEPQCYVALQTYRASTGLLGGQSDEESPPFAGEFTHFWSEFNGDLGAGAKSTVPKNNVFRPLYAVSRRWTDFAFHLPTRSELTLYWLKILPAFCSARPKLVQAAFALLDVDGPGGGGTGERLSVARRLCCYGVLSALRRARMRFWPPQVIETGHGFKLIRA